MTSPTGLAPNTLIHQRYLIVRLIGQGGMGAVYEAIDQRLGNTVALKQTLLNGDQFERVFEREARLLAGLRHPALPVVSDYFTEDHNRFLVMQYIPGADFAELQNQRNAPFPLSDVLRWADQLLDVLDYLHTQQPPIIHRDIKPQNMKLTPRGELILLDFGLAKGATTQSGANSTASLISYTPQYSPPEQIQGTGAGPRGDLYALAATLYRLLTNVPPANALERMHAALNSQADPLRSPQALNPAIPNALNTLLIQALALNPDHRPANATVMREALRQTAQNQSPTASLAHTGPTIVERSKQTSMPSDSPSTSRTALAGIGCMVVLAIVCIAAIIVGVSQLSRFQNTVVSAPTLLPSATPESDIPLIDNTPEMEGLELTKTSEPIATHESANPPATITADTFATVIWQFGQAGTGQGYFEDARGIALDGQNNIYVSEYSNGRIQKFDSAGTFLYSWLTEGDAPLQSLAADHQGNVYAVRQGNILKYNGTTGELVDTFSDAELSFNSVTLLPNNDLLAFSWQLNDSLVRINPNGEIVTRMPNIIDQQTQKSELDGHVAADALENMFVLGTFNNAVFRFNAEGTFVNKFGSQGTGDGQFSAASAIAVDNYSRVYVSDIMGIQVFDADGRYLNRIPVSVARAMVFDSQNDLYVVTSHQQVIKFALKAPD